MSEFRTYKNICDINWRTDVFVEGKIMPNVALEGATTLQVCRLYRPAFQDALKEQVPGPGPGYVYFIQRESGPVKIGFSCSPKARLASLRTSSSEHLDLLFAVTGDMSHEANIHRRFAHLNLSGEWFRPNPDLWLFIQECAEERGVARGWLRETSESDEAMFSHPYESAKWEHAARLMLSVVESENPVLAKRLMTQLMFLIAEGVEAPFGANSDDGWAGKDLL